MIPVIAKLSDNTVLAGHCEPGQVEKGTLVLHDARMLVYWDATAKGLISIAAKGVTKQCRVSAPSARIAIQRPVLLFVAEITEKAMASIEAEPWS